MKYFNDGLTAQDIATLMDDENILGEEESIPVLLASQPSYPMQSTIRNAMIIQVDGRKVLMLTEGEKTYLSHDIKDAIEW